MNIEGIGIRLMRVQITLSPGATRWLSLLAGHRQTQRDPTKWLHRGALPLPPSCRVIQRGRAWKLVNGGEPDISSHIRRGA